MKRLRKAHSVKPQVFVVTRPLLAFWWVPFTHASIALLKLNLGSPEKDSTKWKWWLLLVWKMCCRGNVLSLMCSVAQSAWPPALPLAFMLSLFCFLVFSYFLPREECGCFKLRTRLQLDFRDVYWALFLHLRVVVEGLEVTSVSWSSLL